MKKIAVCVLGVSQLACGSSSESQISINMQDIGQGMNAHMISPTQAVISIPGLVEEQRKRMQDEVVQTMLDTFFAVDRHQYKEKIRPFIAQNIQQKTEDKLLKLSSSLSTDSPDREKKVYTYMSSLLTDVLAGQDELYNQRIREAKNELPTIKVALITGVTTVLTALISAGVTAVIAFNT